MKALQQPHPVLMMLGLNVLWSITLVASKVGINQFPPLLFSTLRFTVFALPLLPFLRWYPGQMRFLLTAALLSGGVAVALLSTGIKYSGNISATAIATQLTVPFTTLLSIWLLGEVVHWRRWTGIIISLLGMSILSFIRTCSTIDLDSRWSSFPRASARSGSSWSSDTPRASGHCSCKP